MNNYLSKRFVLPIYSLSICFCVAIFRNLPLYFFEHSDAHRFRMGIIKRCMTSKLEFYDNISWVIHLGPYIGLTVGILLGIAITNQFCKK